MSAASRDYNRLATYALVPSRSGNPTAIHCPTGIRIHSLVDPINEARQIAESFKIVPDQKIVLVGGGLGYLAREITIRLAGADYLTVVESDAALHALSEVVTMEWPHSTFEPANKVVISNQSMLLRLTRVLDSEIRAVISPYLSEISLHESHSLAGYVLSAATKRVSAPIYNALLDARLPANSATLALKPSWRSAPLDRSKIACIIGAGPSLQSCIEWMKCNRTQLQLLASSGSVPVLLRNTLIPDIVFAMEALPSLISDIRDLPESVNLIAFPGIAPVVIEQRLACLLNGAPTDDPLISDGGSTVIPALDFAIKQRSNQVLLMGVDLGETGDSYAPGALRANHASAGQIPLKYRVMRVALEQTIASAAGGLSVYHLLPYGKPLRGTTHIRPDKLMTLLQAETEVLAHA